MIELPANGRWKLIGGLPVLAEGDCCVVAYLNNTLNRVVFTVGGIFEVLEKVHKGDNMFSAAEKLLDDYLAKKREEDIETVHRTDLATVFRRKSNGKEALVVPSGHVGWTWCMKPQEWSTEFLNTRESAEAAAKQALMEGK